MVTSQTRVMTVVTLLPLAASLFAAGTAVVRCLAGALQMPRMPILHPSRAGAWAEQGEDSFPGPEVHSSPGPESSSVSCVL